MDLFGRLAGGASCSSASRSFRFAVALREPGFTVAGTCGESTWSSEIGMSGNCGRSVKKNGFIEYGFHIIMILQL